MSKPTKEIIGSVHAIFCSDIHLSLTPPVFRSNEPDWFAAMARPLNEIKALKEKHNCNVYCAGDIFHKWNAPPELINFAIKNLPYMITIPGQHDLPYHKLEEIERSAYHTLVMTEAIYNISSQNTHLSKHGVYMTGFPYGVKLKRNQSNAKEDQITVAMKHEYTWKTGFGYPGAPEENRVINMPSNGYDFVVCGDNHQAFKSGKTVNCGTLMVRNANEINYIPSVWLLVRNRQRYEMVRHQLDTSEDVYLDTSVLDAAGIDVTDMKGLIAELQKLESDSFDFEKAIEVYCKGHKVKKAIIEILKANMG